MAFKLIIQKPPGFALRVAGWVCDGMTRSVLTPTGEVANVPLLVIYADTFQTESGEPLALPSQIVTVVLSKTLAARGASWSLGERLAVTGWVLSFSLLHSQHAQALTAVRRAIATLDRNGLAKLQRGQSFRGRQIKQFTAWQTAYQAGDIDLETLQRREENAFTQSSPALLRQLRRLHQKELATRKSALTRLVKGARRLPALDGARHIQRLVTKEHLVDFSPHPEEEFVSMARVPIRPKISGWAARKPAVRIKMMDQLHHYRQQWLKAGRPTSMLPDPGANPATHQAWLDFEADRALASATHQQVRRSQRVD